MMSQKNSGQGAYRNGRKPNLHNGVPGVERFNDKRKYYKKPKTRQSSLVALQELTKDWIEWTPEELALYAENEWHEMDEWDTIIGSDPNFTGDMSTGDYIRDIRGGMLAQTPKDKELWGKTPTGGNNG